MPNLIIYKSWLRNKLHTDTVSQCGLLLIQRDSNVECQLDKLNDIRDYIQTVALTRNLIGLFLMVHVHCQGYIILFSFLLTVYDFIIDTL